MQAVTIRQDEAAPAAYPDAPEGLSPAATALDADMVWARIEAYVAYRWTPRAATWIVEGPGDWSPPLAPAIATSVEVWRDNAWQAANLAPSPLGGFVFPGDGPYRVGASVGSGSPAPVVPPAVVEAWRRLAEYMAADPGTPGASHETVNVGPINEQVRRHPAWMARAMQNSGAGDLLRPYRRAV